MKKWILFSLLWMWCQNEVIAQSDDLLSAPTDPEYIDNHSDRLTLRTFVSRKIIGYQVGHSDAAHEVEYSPNDRTSIGVGFTYKALGLNLNFNLPALNDDDDVYGKTKVLDLATYLYLRKFTIDAFIQSYKGQYLSDNDILSSRAAEGPYILRPDLRTQYYGINGQYVFNHQRFSYRASFLQNEWQRKSAGSFLVGISLHHMRANADSAIIPSFIDDFDGSPVSDFSESASTSLGINAGYAHTFVYKRHLFATLALTGGIGGNRSMYAATATGAEASGFGLHLNGTLRVAAGYNSANWYVGATYTNFLNRNLGPSEAQGLWQQGNSGIYSLILARRFDFRRNKG